MGFMLSFHDHNCKDRIIAGSDIRTDRMGLYCWSERGAKPGVGRIENRSDHWPNPKDITVGKIIHMRRSLLSLASLIYTRSRLEKRWAYEIKEE